jgi:hypothetical protein
MGQSVSSGGSSARTSRWSSARTSRWSERGSGAPAGAAGKLRARASFFSFLRGAKHVWKEDNNEIAIEAEKFFRETFNEPIDTVYPPKTTENTDIMDRDGYRRHDRERSPPRDRSPPRNRRRTEDNQYEDDRWYAGIVREEMDRRERERAGAARRSPPRSGRGRVRDRLGPPQAIRFDGGANIEEPEYEERRSWSNGGRGNEALEGGSSSGHKSNRSVRGTSVPGKRRGGAWSILRGSSLDALPPAIPGENVPPIAPPPPRKSAKESKYKKKMAVPVSKEKFKKLPKGKAPIILAVVLGDELSPAWSERLPGKVKWAINSALKRRSENAFRAKKTGEHTDPPIVNHVYTSNDRTHIRIEVSNKRSQIWVNKVLQEQFGLSTTPIAALQTITWYSTRVEDPDILEQSPQLTRQITAYVNKLDIDDIVIGEGLRYGRRMEGDVCIVFIGLKQPAKDVIKLNRFVINLGGHGDHRLYPCEEGEEGPDDLESESEVEEEDGGGGDGGGGEEEDDEEDPPADPGQNAGGGGQNAGGGGLEEANGGALDGIISDEEVPNNRNNGKEAAAGKETRKRATRRPKGSGAGKI